MTYVLYLETLLCIGSGGKLGAPDDCIVLGSILSKSFPNTGEQVSDIRISETEPQEEHLLADQLACQHLEEARASAPVEFVIIFCNYHLGWMVNRSMHLIKDCVRPWLIV